MNDLVSRGWLLEEYDRRHKGPRGGAYQMILDAPTVDIAEVLHDEFANIWNAEIDHPKYQDTVGELMERAVQAIENAVIQNRRTED